MVASSTRKRHVVSIGRPICGLLWLLRRRMTPFLFTWKVAQVCRIFFRGRPLIRVVLDRRGRVKHFPDALIFRNSLSELSLELYNRNIQSVGGGVGLGQFGGPEKARLPQVDGDENAPFPQN